MFSKGIIPLNTLITSGWIESFDKMEQYKEWNDGNIQGSGQLCESFCLLNNLKTKQLNIQHLPNYEN